MSTGSTAVLHLRASNFLGGPERQILRYCTGSAPQGRRQLLASFTASAAPDGGEGWALLEAAKAAGREAYALPFRPRQLWAAAGALKAVIESQAVGLVCTHGYRADLVGTLAARRAGVPVAWFLRGWTGEDFQVRLYERLDRTLLRFADRVVCLSKTQTNQLPHAIARERLQVVVNAIETRITSRPAAREELRRRYGFGAEGECVMAVAGRLSPEKGAELFLHAAAESARKHPHTRFLVFGDGPLRARLQAERDRLGLTDVVHFAGHVADWAVLLPGLDVVVNPSLAEQAPNVVLEAMAAGAAIVATTVGSVAEIAGEPPALRLVPPGNAAAMATAMSELAANPELRAGLGERARTRVGAAYSLETQRDQLRTLYDALAPLPRTAGHSATVLPRVSLVLPVRNEVRHLGALLDQLLAQDYAQDRFEVVVSDGGAGGPDDGTAAMAQDYARRFPGRVRWVPNPGQRSSAGRNCGWRAATGDWVIFVDGHCAIPGPDWLQRQMQEASRTGARCLSRPQPLTSEPGNFLQAVIAHARGTRIGHGADSTIYDAQARGWVNPSSSGAAYERALIEHLGGYDERFDACEDVEFNHRIAAAGIRAWLSPEAVVSYAARASLGGLWRQLVRYGRGRVRLARKHPEAASLAQWVPALWLAWLPAALALAFLAHGPLRWAAAATLGLYFGSVAIFSLGLGLRYGWRHAVTAPAVYCTIHASLGAGQWRELVSRPRSGPAPVPPRIVLEDPSAGSPL